MPIPYALLPVPRQRFFDENGDPLANGYLSFFETGTSTPLEVYADADGNTSLGTTVTLDANGEAVAIYVLPQGYRVSLFDEDDALQWTQDQVEDVGQTFLATLGNEFATGDRDVTSGYTVTATDNFITVDSTGGADPCIINLQPAADRGLPIGIKNLGTEPLAVTPDGTETIDGVAAAFTVPVASSPTFPCIWLMPDEDGSGYWILASHGL